MLTNRQKKILNFLLSENRPHTSFEISEAIGINRRTLRDDLKIIKDVLSDYDCELNSKPNIGYQAIIDEDKYLKIEHLLSESKVQIPDSDEDRVKYCIYQLITTNEYLKIDDLCEHLYISRSILSKNLKDAEEIFKKFNLTINRSGRNGIVLVGNEKEKRLCLSYVFFNHIVIDQLFTESDIRLKNIQIISNNIKDLIVDLLVSDNINIYGVAFENLVTHIAIAIFRVRESNYITKDLTPNINVEDTTEYEIAKKIVARLENCFNVNFPIDETKYITIHLMSKKIIDQSSIKSIDSMDSKIKKIVNLMIESINNRMHIDFTNDRKLQLALGLHLIPLLNRLNFNMKLKNPLVDEIKIKYIRSFEIAIVACETISSIYGVEICDDEIAYLALHFEYAMQRLRKNIKAKVIIVCASGKATSQLVFHQLENKLSDYIEIIGVCDYITVRHTNYRDLDFIISTIPLNINLPIPIIQISIFVTDEEIKRILSFIDERKERSSREVILRKYFREDMFYTDINVRGISDLFPLLYEKVAEKYNSIPIDFVESLFERERITSTEYGNLVAIPHPLKHFGGTNFIATFILDKPIVWKNKKVQLVLLFYIASFEDDLDVVYKTIVRFIEDINVVKLVIEDKSFDNLIYSLSLKNINKKLSDQNFDDKLTNLR